MKSQLQTHPVPPLAIDIGAGRIKISYFDAQTNDVEPMRLGAQGEFYIPAYFGVNTVGRVVVGEDAEAMIHHESEREFTKDNFNRDLFYFGSLVERLDLEPQNKSIEQLWVRIFENLKSRVLKHPAFQDKSITTVYLTYTTQYTEHEEMLLEASAKQAFEPAAVQLVEETHATAEMLRNVPSVNVPTTHLILIDIGASTAEACYLHWEASRYATYTSEALNNPRLSIACGGINVDEALLKLVAEKAGEKYNPETDFVSVRQQVRLAKEMFSQVQDPSDAASEIRVNPIDTVSITAEEIKTAIDAFIEDFCQQDVLKDYVAALVAHLKDSVPKTKPPTLVLVGGSAKLKGLSDALGNAFELNVADVNAIPRSDYAAVVGAIYLNHPRKSEHRSTATESEKPAPIQDIAFSTDAEYLAIASGRDVTLWQTGAATSSVMPIPQAAPIQHTNTVSTIAFSPDGTLLATATHAGEIYLHDPKTQAKVREFNNDAPVTCLAFSPDSTHFATGDAAHVVKLWNIHTGDGQETYVKYGKYRHTRRIRSLAFSPDGTKLVSGGEDCVAKVWYISREKKKPLTTYLPEMFLAADLVTSSVLRNLINRATATRKLEYKVPVVHVWWHSNDEMGTLALNGKRNRWDLYDTGKFDRVYSLVKGNALICEKSAPNWKNTDLLANEKEMLTGGSLKDLQGVHENFISDGSLKLTENLTFPYPETLSCIAFLRQSEDNVLFAFGAQDGTIKLWNGTELITFRI